MEYSVICFSVTQVPMVTLNPTLCAKPYNQSFIFLIVSAWSFLNFLFLSPLVVLVSHLFTYRIWLMRYLLSKPKIPIKCDLNEQFENNLQMQQNTLPISQGNREAVPLMLMEFYCLAKKKKCYLVLTNGSMTSYFSDHIYFNNCSLHLQSWNNCLWLYLTIVIEFTPMLHSCHPLYLSLLWHFQMKRNLKDMYTLIQP